jgi:hypothetical protein
VRALISSNIFLDLIVEIMTWLSLGSYMLVKAIGSYEIIS